MTHSDIYTKFMIEYDKANITSSYPSLTRYEIATLLDKAYLALISQKISGNNARKAGFEFDVKAVEDLRGLIKTAIINQNTSESTLSKNELSYNTPLDLLYYIQSQLIGTTQTNANVQLQTHETANNFRVTNVNMPWIETPVAYIENNSIHVLVDYHTYSSTMSSTQMKLTYLHKPTQFTKTDLFDNTEFELQDTVAEELINLAIVFATESTQSSRLQTKTSILSLES